MANRRRIGTEYEKKALSYLEEKGYRLIEKNFRCRTGEIDLIAWEEKVLVFLEVKYRRGEAYGYPAEAVDTRKQRTICRVADYYRLTHEISEIQACRFDVVAIKGDEITLIRNAFPYQSGGD